MSKGPGNTPADKNYQPSGITKAEQAALEKYPYQRAIHFPDGLQEFDRNSVSRTLFQEGYEAAEKDLALTIEDLELLHTFLYAVKNNKSGCFTFTRLSDEQYQEVLRRFNERKTCH